MHHVRDALPTLPAHALQLVGTVSAGASAGPSQLGAGFRPASKWWRKAMLGTIALATLVAIGCGANSASSAGSATPTATVTAMLIGNNDLSVQVAITDGTTLSTPIAVQVGLTGRPSQAVTLTADTSNPTATTQFDDLAPGSYTLTATATGLTITIPDGSGTITASPLIPTTWTSRTSDTLQHLRGIHHDGTDTWVAVGASGTILSSSDGTTWTSRTSGTSQQLNGIHHDGTDTWVAVGVSGTILSSSDGTLWTSRTSGTSQQLNGIHHDGTDTWVAVGASGTILTSSDGTLWTSRTSGTSRTLNGIHNGTDSWVAVGDVGTILTTSDPTATWTSRNSDTQQRLNSIHHDGDDTWVAVGLNGTILTASDPTGRWAGRTSNTIQQFLGIHHDGTGTLVAVGTGGTIRTTSDPTATWTSQNSNTSQRLNSIHHDGTDTWVAVGDGGIIRTATPTVNPPTAPPIIPLPPAAPTINLDQTYTNSDGSRFQITIAKPLFKVYAITLLDSADATLSGDIELSIGRTAAGDADARLRKGPVTGLAATASPTGGDFNGGTVWLFLPGDDGADLPEDIPADFAMLWQTDGDGLIYPSGSNGPLAASLDYTLSVTAPAGRTWQLRITDISSTSPPRLPSGIQTRARRGMCGDPVPIPLMDDTVTCDEGGPAANGQGLYLLYNPDAAQQRFRLDKRVQTPPTIPPTPLLIDTSSDDDDGLGDTSSLAFNIRQNCMNTGSGAEASILFADSSIGVIRSKNTPEEGQVYCIQLSGANTTRSNLASDNLQFTLNP